MQGKAWLLKLDFPGLEYQLCHFLYLRSIFSLVKCSTLLFSILSWRLNEDIYAKLLAKNSTHVSYLSLCPFTLEQICVEYFSVLLVCWCTGVLVCSTIFLCAHCLNRKHFLGLGCWSVTKLFSKSFWPHGLQHTRLPCPSSSPGICLNSCPLIDSVMPSDHLILCHPLLLLPSIFPSIRVFSSDSALHWPKYWSFSISPSNEYSGLISFRIDWFDLTLQRTLKSLLQHHNSLALSFLCGPTLT